MPSDTAIPPLVGRKQAADILGVSPNHTHKIKEFPPSLQERGFPIDMAAPAWTREEIEALAARRATLNAG